MDFVIENCNSIDKANINIVKEKLNIKFAPNGTGKSTIAKAITLCVEDESLEKLMPFKLRKDNSDNIKPSVDTASEIDSVMCFNEDYVRQFTFQADELLSNSFDILIKNEAYIDVEKEIEHIVQEIKGLFVDNVELDTLIANLKELGAAFKLTKTGISKSSPGMKGLSGGNTIEHIPSELEPYKEFIRSPNNVSWIDWQTKGQKEFSSLSECCPFCSNNIQVKKPQIKKVSQVYDKNIIKNLVGIIGVIDKLGEYFSEDTKLKLQAITSLPNGLDKEHELFLSSIKNQIDTLIDKLEKLKVLNGFDFKQGEKVNDKLNDYKLDLQFFSLLDSDKTQEAIKFINDSIEGVSKKAGLLQGKIAIQRSGMKKLIEKHQSDINSFLSYAGYKYKVLISGEDDKCQLKLQHIEYDDFVSGGDQHLSFGERNAFAIVLFMYECLSKKPDLIILDDPISSFDKNKKFAILQMLFRRDAVDCLKSKTVLMLTHDVEPIIDTLKAVSKQFDNQVLASYLRYDSGIINEFPIDRNDIKTFSLICSDYLKTEADLVLKLIYLRRHYEIVDDMGDAYQVISNLLHLRGVEEVIDTRQDGHPILESSKLDKGITDIVNRISGFDYETILGRLQSKETLKELYDNCSNGYEKLQVFRLFKDINVDSSVLQKFINETYHIENEFICQLDPTKYDLIPEYVVNACDKCLEEAEL